MAAMASPAVCDEVGPEYLHNSVVSRKRTYIPQTCTELITPPESSTSDSRPPPCLRPSPPTHTPRYWFNLFPLMEETVTCCSRQWAVGVLQLKEELLEGRLQQREDQTDPSAILHAVVRGDYLSFSCCHVVAKAYTSALSLSLCIFPLWGANRFSSAHAIYVCHRVQDTERLFGMAANHMITVKGLTLPSDQRLELYSLFKQATEGDCEEPKPGLIDLVGRAKW